MSSKSTILTEHHNIQTPCKLFIVGEPQVLLIQPSARHEEKNDGVRSFMPGNCAMLSCLPT